MTGSFALPLSGGRTRGQGALRQACLPSPPCRYCYNIKSSLMIVLSLLLYLHGHLAAGVLVLGKDMHRRYILLEGKVVVLRMCIHSPPGGDSGDAIGRH
eukprot:1195771-Prorocentrum_minimum.AAC.5